MKNLLITAAAFIAICFMSACGLTNHLGDVKYSVLPPDQFVKENGSDWVLMDADINNSLKGSALSIRYGITGLPDARGMFIRGLNLNRNDAMADPFVKENRRERRVGEFESDTVGPHGHGWTGGSGDAYPKGMEDRVQGDPSTLPFSVPRNSHLNYAFTGMGTETRPKNIALYIYVKINK